MAYRFTKTEKWQDGWFRRLSPNAKLLFLYLCDNCDIAGFWEIDFENAAFHTGLDTQAVETAFKELGKCYLKNEKYVWLRTFLKHQKNLPLNPKVAAHRGAIIRLAEHKDLLTDILEVLQENASERVRKGLLNPIGIGIGKGKGKESSRTKKFQKPTANEVSEYAKSIGFQLDGEKFINHYEANGWIRGKTKMKDWKAAVRYWKTLRKDECNGSRKTGRDNQPVEPFIR